jgi:hypothetical protein
MTANMYVSLLVDEDNRHEPMAGFLDATALYAEVTA